MEKTDRINLRVEPHIKRECEAIAKASGVSLSSLINSYLTSLAHRGKIPLISLAKARNGHQKEDILSFATIYQTVNDVLSTFPANKVRKAYLFGSYSRGEATKESDVDILLESGDQMSLFDLGRINGELSERFQRPVDTVPSSKSLDPRIAENVMKERKIIYESNER
jgi:predicted nucleotidyltransferase